MNISVLVSNERLVVSLINVFKRQQHTIYLSVFKKNIYPSYAVLPEVSHTLKSQVIS